MNYLNIHALVSHSPSCLNRDDMNMQKSAVFGGVRRARVSSQCLKHWMRKDPAFADRIGDPSIRTLEMGLLRTRLVTQEKLDEKLVDKVLALLTEKSAKSKKGKKEEAETGEKSGVAVAPWSIAEIRYLCDLVADGADEKDLKKRMGDDRAARLKQLSANADIALFGRMSTSPLMTPVDGSCSVAHAITTHETDADVDWFTAVDDLRADSGEAGAGHLNTQEFGAGVFYRYASVNLKQLAANLGEEPVEKARKIGGDLAHLLATVMPGGKQHSFAAHNPADYVLCVRSAMPISLANAFEKPVSRGADGGFLDGSIRAIETYFRSVYQGYGIPSEAGIFSLRETATLDPRFKTFPELVEWVQRG